MRNVRLLHIPPMIKYGFLCLAVFGILIYILATLFSIIYAFWHAPMIIILPHTAHSLLLHITEYIGSAILTAVAAYPIGFFVYKYAQRHSIKKFFDSIPVVNFAWRVISGITRAFTNLESKPFVLLKDWYGPGHATIGIIVGKQIFNDNPPRAYPRVAIINIPNPIPSGYFDFPERDKIRLLTVEANQMIEMILSLGTAGPEAFTFEEAKDQSLLDFYYDPTPTS